MVGVLRHKESHPVQGIRKWNYEGMKEVQDAEAGVQVEVDPGDIETSITNIQEQINTPVEDAVRDKVISSGSVTIDTENLNILVDEKLDINITYVPMGHVREMNLTFAVENPYAAS